MSVILLPPLPLKLNKNKCLLVEKACLKAADEKYCH